MTVFPPDERRVIRPNELDYTKLPLPGVTAIDTKLVVPNKPPFGFGTGVVISPHYVLTAAHNLYDKSIGENGKRQDAIRVSSSGNQNSLENRRIGDGVGDPGDNVDVTTGLFFPAPEFFNVPEFDFQEPKHDIAVFEVNDNDLISPVTSVGLIAFLDPKTAKGLEIQTAGYPVDNVPNTFPPRREDNPGIPDRDGNDVNEPGDFSRQARDLVLAPGSFEQQGEVFAVAGRRIEYTDNIDTEAGQSGSPIWHTLEGDEPRVLGVHSRRAARRNAGTLIDKEVYDKIMAQIEGDGDPNLLPENAIIGSDPSFLGFIGGNDQIVGTYRRERIIGNKGNDILFGEGADDRLEGGEGDDQLIGGAGDDQLDGGTNLPILDPLDDFIEIDVAIFSGNMIEYQIETDSSGGIFGTPIGEEETITTITHLNGGIDGVDTLTNIEFVQFKGKSDRSSL